MNLHSVPDDTLTLLVAYFKERYKSHEFKYEDKRWSYRYPNNVWARLGPADMETHLRRAKEWRLTGTMP